MTGLISNQNTNTNTTHVELNIKEFTRGPPLLL